MSNLYTKLRLLVKTCDESKLFSQLLPSDRENIILNFKIWLENITRNYDINSFVKLPWNWNLMIKDKVLQPFFYYAKENYINGKPEVMTDDEISIITFVNLKQIPQDELSKVNLHTGNPINIQSFLNFCKNPLGWYDEKIDQIYDSMKILGKTPEYYGGKDIR